MITSAVACNPDLHTGALTLASETDHNRPSVRKQPAQLAVIKFITFSGVPLMIYGA